MDLGGFLKAVFGDWVGWMSGIGSVILAATGFWVKTKKRQVRWLSDLHLFIAAAIVFLFISAPHVWTLQHEEAKRVKEFAGKLQGELDGLTKPELRGTISGKAVAPGGPKNKDLILVVLATVENRGAPSIAKGFRVGLNIEGVLYWGTEIITTQVISFDVRGQKIQLNLSRADALPGKASLQPIPMNGAVSGHLIVYIRDVQTTRAWSNPSNTVILQFQDITGRPYSAEAVMGSPQQMITSETLQPEPRYSRK